MSNEVLDYEQHVNAPVWASTIKWAIFFSLASFVQTMITYNLGFSDPANQNLLVKVVSTLGPILFSIGFAYLGIKDYKTNLNNNRLDFSRGFIWTLVYAVIASIIGLVLTYVFFAFLAPDFIDLVTDAQLIEMEKQGMDDEQLEQAMEYVGMFMTPAFFALFGGLGHAFYGFIGGMVASLIHKD